MPNTPLTIPVDREHGGLRLVIAAFFVVLLVVGFIVISAVVPAQGINLLAGLGALLIAAGGAYVLEQQLKQRWKSGRAIQVTEDAVALVRQQTTNTELPVSPEVQQLRWQFKINRRTRVPKGWHVVALALESDEQYIAVFTLLSPEDYRELDPDGDFIALTKPNDNEQSLRLAGEQRRLHRAEKVRWHEGVEMTPQDFQTYNDQITRLYPA